MLSYNLVWSLKGEEFDFPYDLFLPDLHSAIANWVHGTQDPPLKERVFQVFVETYTEVILCLDTHLKLFKIFSLYCVFIIHEFVEQSKAAIVCLSFLHYIYFNTNKVYKNIIEAFKPYVN